MEWIPSKSPLTQAVIFLGMARAMKRPFYGRLINFMKSTATLHGKLPVAIRYAKIECAPPTGADLARLGPAMGQMMKGIGNLPNMTIAEIGVCTIILWEIACWFFVGEVIGRRNLKGYKSRIPFVLNEEECIMSATAAYDDALLNL